MSYITQHDKIMVAICAQLLKVVISKSHYPVCGNSLGTKNISPVMLFCSLLFFYSAVSGVGLRQRFGRVLTVGTTKQPVSRWLGEVTHCRIALGLF